MDFCVLLGCCRRSNGALRGFQACICFMRVGPVGAGQLTSGACLVSLTRSKPVRGTKMQLPAAKAASAPAAPALACRPARPFAVWHARQRAGTRVAAGKQPDSGYFSEADPSGARCRLWCSGIACVPQASHLGGCRACTADPSAAGAAAAASALRARPPPLHAPSAVQPRCSPSRAGCRGM